MSYVSKHPEAVASASRLLTGWRSGYDESFPGGSLTAITTQQARPSFRFTHRQSVALVFACTILGAAAQILMKSGSGVVSTFNVVAILTNLSLFGGYCLYGVSTVLLMLALRDSELSLLYPIISLSYVWVTFLSVLVFQETLNVFKIVGISTIVVGVAVLGRNGKRK